MSFGSIWTMPISPAQAPVVSKVELVQRVKLRGGEDLGLEKLGPAAVMREGQKGVAGVEVALDLAEIGLEGPEGQKDATRRRHTRPRRG